MQRVFLQFHAKYLLAKYKCMHAGGCNERDTPKQRNKHMQNKMRELHVFLVQRNPSQNLYVCKPLYPSEIPNHDDKSSWGERKTQAASKILPSQTVKISRGEIHIIKERCVH